MIGEVPDGWAVASLDSLCEKVRGVSYQRGEARSAAAPDHVPVLRANNIGSEGLVFDDLVWVPARCASGRQKLKEGDVVVAMSSGSKNVVGKAAQFLGDWDGSFGAFCGVLRPNSEVDHRYFGLFLRTGEYRSRISDLAGGTNINNLKNEHFAQISVPVAPFAEQRRIVATLDALLGKVETCRQRLDRIPIFMKRFRQSVLAAACSGRLTADWRGGESSPTGVRSDGETPSNLPGSWAWRAFAAVSREITVGYVGPMASEYVENGVPFLRSLNVRPFRYDPTDLKYVRREFHQRIRKSRLGPGDVAIVRSGNSGVACVIPESVKDANCSDLVILRPGPSLLPDFACMFLNSNAGRAHVNSVKVGIAQGHFNVGSMKTTVLPVPPLAEQREIVLRVAALFTVADKIEVRCTEARKSVDLLTPSLLAKAFRGDLVPTEAELARAEGREFESAAALLERIRTASAPHGGATRPSRASLRRQARTRRRA